MSTARSSSAESSHSDVLAFSSKVFRRDGGKTDYLVLPLFAGVLARCMIAAGPSDHPGDSAEDSARELAHAQRVIDLAARGTEADSWEHDTESYGTVADLLFRNWASLLFFASLSYSRKTLQIPFHARPAELTAAALDWLAAVPAPSLTESAIMAAFVATVNPNDPAELPLLARPSRRVRVLLADRLRRDGLTTWPRVLTAAVGDWTVPTLERLALGHAAAGDAYLHDTIDSFERHEREAARQQAEIVQTAIAEAEASGVGGDTLDPGMRRGDGGPPDAETTAAEELVAGAVAEINQWRAERDRVQRERDRVADRHARAQSRIEALEEEVRSANASLEQAERQLLLLRNENERLSAQLVVEEALAEGAPPPPTDTFAGRRVLLFTGVEAADARAAIAQGFWDLGATQVDVYWTDKARGPDIYPQDAIVAADVTYMGHSEWEGIQDRARRSGAWNYTGKHGAATMARATAAAWRAHLANMAGRR